MSKLQLGFHTTFAFRKGEVARLAAIANRPTGLPQSNEGLMAETGFGTKKVGPIKSWATRAGLIEGTLLTQEGRVICHADPLLKSATTEWFMHFNLSFGTKGFSAPPPHTSDWGGWPYFVFEYLPDHPEFTVDSLIRSAETVFEDPPKLLKANFPYLLRAYTHADGLRACGYLGTTADGGFRAGRNAAPPTALIGYLLTKLWARDFGSTESVLTDSILDQHMGITGLLGMSRSDVQSVLDDLSGEGILEQRRTVAPYTVVRRWNDPIQLLEKAYA
jgi:hypothetical protein